MGGWGDPDLWKLILFDLWEGKLRFKPLILDFHMRCEPEGEKVRREKGASRTNSLGTDIWKLKHSHHYHVELRTFQGSLLSVFNSRLSPICHRPQSKKPTCLCFSFPFPLQPSSLTEKAWNRLKVQPQNNFFKKKNLLACTQACLHYAYTLGPKRETMQWKNKTAVCLSFLDIEAFEFNWCSTSHLRKGWNA